MNSVPMVLLLTGLLVCSCSRPARQSGIEQTNFDATVRPQDNFFRYVNGQWLDNTRIPPDKSDYGSFTELFDLNEKRLRELVEDAAARTDEPEGSDLQKVGDFYKSYMDTVLIEKLGVEPLRPTLNEIAAISDYDGVIRRMALLQRDGADVPVGLFVSQDARNTTEYIIYLTQSGLGLPDRDYYFNQDEKFKNIRNSYAGYIQKLLELAGEAAGKPAEGKAARIIQLETDLAQAQWTRVQNRDREKTYNKFDLTGLKNLAPALNWRVYFEAVGVNGPAAVIVRQPSYLEAFGKMLRKFPLDDWKSYLAFKALDAAAPVLSRAFADANFEFHDKIIRGIDQKRARWKEAISAENNVLGEVVGRLYVEKYFTPEAKKRMVMLVENLRHSFHDRIEQLDWMGAATKKEALEKLDKISTKIGYPDQWRDYSRLTIRKDELFQNTVRAGAFEFQRAIDKLGKPVDRGEWLMNPQRVNAYYNPPMNEIVFPAAILEPPFFNMAADDAVNYGAIGAVIGHELSHGFDDQGRKSDGDGNLRDWWTDADAREFQQRAQLMVEQYDQFNPIDTMHVKGKLTLGENIGDLGGLTVAYHAYQLSLKGKPAPLIDGLSGDQRFFMGWAQVWRRIYRDAELRRRLLIDPHSPSEYRVNGIVSNMPEFYAAFDVKPGDQLYRPEDVRVRIW